MTEYSDNLTPDQYRREGFQAGIEAAALAAEDRTPSKHGGALAAHVTGMAIQKAIRAIDVDDVLAGMPPAPDAVAGLVDAARAFVSWDQCWPGNINLEAVCQDIRAALAAMEASHGE